MSHRALLFTAGMTSSGVVVTSPTDPDHDVAWRLTHMWAAC